MKYPRQPLHSESWGSFDRLSAKRCHCEPVLTLARQSVSKTYKSCAFRRFLPEKVTDSHTSDIGHWFGMTGAGFIDTQKRPASPVFFLINTKIHRETGGKRIDNVEKIWYNDLLYIGRVAP